MLGFIMNRLRAGKKAALQEERRLILGAPSEPGDFIECTLCGKRFEYDPNGRPSENTFIARWERYADHLRIFHPTAGGELDD